ncbi:MAG: hypothetical protein WD716_14245 [Fimbriimonadaceae bacterium]
MIASLLFFAAGQQAVPVPDRIHLCAVVPTSRASTAQEELIELPDLNDKAFQSRWIVEFDDDSTYVFPKDDHAISFYSERLAVYEKLRSCIATGGPVTLADLPPAIRTVARNNLSRFASLPVEDERVPVQIGVTEHYVFTNSGRSIEANLEFPLGKRVAVPTLQEGEIRPKSGTPGVHVQDGATEGLAFLNIGPKITHRANANLSERAFKRYADTVRRLEESAELTALEVFGLAANKSNYRLEPLSYKPTLGSQLDDRRLGAVMVSGIPVNHAEGIDVGWLKGAEIIDQYFYVSFTVHQANDKGVIDRGSGYRIAIRRKS